MEARGQEDPPNKENEQLPGRGKRFWSHLVRALTVPLTRDPSDLERESRTHRTVLYFRRLESAFSMHQCSLMACACAYCALLSLVPLLVIGISAFGFFLGSNSVAKGDILTALQRYAPNQADFYKATDHLLTRILEDRQLIGVFGIFGLLYAAHQAFLAMQPAMNIIWGVKESRHWLKQRLIAVIAAVATILLLGLNLAAIAAVAYLQRYSVPYVPGNVIRDLEHFVVGMAPVALMVLLFTALYRLLPSRDVPWKSALLGAVVAAMLWQ